MRQSFALALVSVVALVPLPACGVPAESASEVATEEGFVDASAESRQSLGVTRWRTMNAPTSIDGLDENGHVVVALEHHISSDGVETQYTVGLREHDRVFMRRFKFPNAATGADRFVMLDQKRSAGFSSSRALELLSADLQKIPKATRLTATSLSTTDLTDDQEEVALVCGGREVSVPINSAKACLSDNAIEVLAWCPDFARNYGKCDAYVSAGGR